jgi:hypothetical protein
MKLSDVLKAFKDTFQYVNNFKNGIVFAHLISYIKNIWESSIVDNKFHRKSISVQAEINDLDSDQSDITLDATPTIDPSSDEWCLSPRDIDCIALGAGILGCGGGGCTHDVSLWAKRLLSEGKSIRVISPERLGHIPYLFKSNQHLS